MDLTNKSQAELNEMLISLASSLTEEDMKDPETFGLVSQLLDILDPKAKPLPKELVQQVKEIADPKQRFAAAAQAMGLTGEDEMKALAESMKAEGLLKSEDPLLKALLQDVSNSHILLYPVTINGRSKPSNDEVHQYHITLKWLTPDGPKDGVVHKPEELQDMVNRYQLHPPDTSKLTPAKLNTRFGPMHILKLDDHPHLTRAHDELSENNPSRFPFMPHISVEQELHDKILNGEVKPEDLNIKVHPLEYRIGSKPVHRFIPAPQATAHFPPIGNMKKSEELLKKAAEILEKRSKNVRRQIEATNSGAEGEEKAVSRYEDYAKKHLGIHETVRIPSAGALAEKHFGDRKAVGKLTDEHKKAAGWKPNDKGEYIRKPSLKTENGKTTLYHLGTEKSVRHELAHHMRNMDGWQELDHKMQSGFGQISSKAAERKKTGADLAIGSKNQHAWQGEYETRAIESKLARLTGSNPLRETVSKQIETEETGKDGKPKMKTVPKTEKDAPQVGMNGARKGQDVHIVVPEHTAMQSSVVRRDKEAKQKAGYKKKMGTYNKKVAAGKEAGEAPQKPQKEPVNMVHLNARPENIRPAINERIEQKVGGEIKTNPETTKPEAAHDVNAKINGRAAGRRDIKADAKAAAAAKPKKEKEPEQLSFKLAASEHAMKPGMSYNKLKELEKKAPGEEYDSKGRIIGLPGVPDKPTHVSKDGMRRIADKPSDNSIAPEHSASVTDSRGMRNGQKVKRSPK